MVFLVDYENVNYCGLEGLEFLTEEDTLKIFYNDKCPKIIRKQMDEILASGCQFEICKLKVARRNGLDFYIASCVGEIFANDSNENVGIVSLDKGFNSVLDYWHARLENEKQLIKCGTLAKCMYSCAEKSDRRVAALAKYERVSLQGEYDNYIERKKLEKIVKHIFADLKEQYLLSDIIDLVVEYKSPKERYTHSLKKFGKTKGLDIYRTLRENIVLNS